MNPEFQLARFILFSMTVFLGCITLALWCYALIRTRLWFLSLLAVNAFMNVGFGLISLAIMWNTRAWVEKLGQSGFMKFYNVLLFGQALGDVIALAGVTFLVVWLCKTSRDEPRL